MTLDDAIDRLYGVDLEEFATERARLAKELRAEGRRDDAAVVAKLRKPTVAAWVLNQLARRNRREVDLLLHAGHRLRQSQAGVVRGGKRESFEQARQTEAEALRHLAREAEALLRAERGTASDAVLNQVGQGLRAAAVSDEERERLARGTFDRPPDEAAGFGLLSSMVGDIPDEPKPRAPSKPRADAQRRAKAELRDARRRLRDARAELRRAETAAAKAQRTAETAAAHVESAEQEVERLERAVD
jgi:hypothetical protein